MRAAARSRAGFAKRCDRASRVAVRVGIALVMSPQTLLSRSLALASAVAAVFVAPSGIALALAADTAPTAPQSKSDANMSQLQITDTAIGTGAEAVKGKTDRKSTRLNSS